VEPVHETTRVAELTHANVAVGVGVKVEVGVCVGVCVGVGGGSISYPDIASMPSPQDGLKGEDSQANPTEMVCPSWRLGSAWEFRKAALKSMESSTWVMSAEKA
jgi:hypothetical protein